ncbi:pre-mRNA 3' end processing protein WDR33-like, partial [Plectropomus leopardus]|uniref:pre-mRNA 3' end processing protein WDR33-like n=1 Tax=Plectropomus leopardus TaxID=160734 RepID=UPI001C4AEBC3
PVCAGLNWFDPVSGCLRFRGGGPGRPGARGYPEEYGGQEEGFDGEEMVRGWEGGVRGRPPLRGGGPPRGGGHDGYRDVQQMHDGSSPAGRERSSSLQGMDMASLPPRKRPWQDGPGDPRERESPGADGGEDAVAFLVCVAAAPPTGQKTHCRLFLRDRQSRLHGG